MLCRPPPPSQLVPRPLCARTPFFPVGGWHPQYADAKRVIAKSHKTRSDVNDYIAAVVVPLLKDKASTRTSAPTSGGAGGLELAPPGYK